MKPEPIFSVTRRPLLALALLCASAAAVPGAQAKGDDYPNRQVRLISPYTPGGGNDTLSRIIASKLTIALGEPMLVMNKPGANTIIGNDFVAKAAPDGYSLVMNGNGFVINPNFYKQLPYDTAKDLVPVSFIGFSTEALVSNPDLPVKTVPELIALAKSKPGQLNYATSGRGGPGDFAGVQLDQMAGMTIKSIPYNGTAQALTDLMGGQVQLSIIPLSSVPHGKVRLLAIGTKERSPHYPDVPTIGESVPGYEAFLWYGIFTTAGTPAPVIHLLDDEIGKVLRQPDVVKSLQTMGIAPRGPEYATPEKFAAFVKSELVKSASIAKTAGIKAE